MYESPITLQVYFTSNTGTPKIKQINSYLGRQIKDFFSKQ